MINLISILSYGHSGSTLSDMLLGASENFQATGELAYFPWQLYRDGKKCELNQDICTCGKPFSQCEFWKNVIKNAQELLGTNIISNPLGFKINFTNHQIYSKESLVTKIKSELIRRLFQFSPFAFSVFVRTFMRKRIKNNLALLNSIQKVSQKKFIIDSSKRHVRYLSLKSDKSINTKLLVIVRDLEGVVNSYIKRGNHNVDKICKSYLKNYNHKIWRIIKQLDPQDYIVYSYEKLVKNPESFISTIESFVDVPKSNPNFDYERHLVAGNPSRYKPLVINHDKSWETDLSDETIELIKSYKLQLKDVFKVQNS